MYDCFFFIIIQDELARVVEHYKLLSNGILERQDTLLKITEQLDIVKQEMDERGSSMTDGSKFSIIHQYNHIILINNFNIQ